MATRSWNEDRAAKRIDGKIAGLPIKDIQIKEYVRDTDLTNLPSNVAYRVNGVHLYADILNLSEMLHVTDVEGEICHKRTLRFLNLHYRAVYRILQRTGAILVDLHNQRLHAVIPKPLPRKSRCWTFPSRLIGRRFRFFRDSENQEKARKILHRIFKFLRTHLNN